MTVINQNNDNGYQSTQLKKEAVIKKLRKKGCRITKQRLVLLDIILEEDCSCCKEIYHKALKQDPKIGAATVYRLVNMLEQIGAISRKNMYTIAPSSIINDRDGQTCMVELEDGTTYRFSAQKWQSVLKAGLERYGYSINQKIHTISMV